MARDLEHKRKYDRERMQRIQKAARGEAPKLSPTEQHRLETALKSEREKNKSTIKDLIDYQEAVDTFSQLTSAPLRRVKRHETKSGLREATAVALLSDAHVEEEVRLGETPVKNVYNPDIADRSLARFFSGFQNLVNLQRHAFKIRNLVLWLGGDLMTGHIHEENVETTSGPPIQTTLWLIPRIKAGIELLLEDPGIEQILVPCSYGNHGRNTKKPYRTRGAVHSYEWLMYQVLASHFKDERRVQFLADQSAHQYAQVYDYTMHFHHGDEIKYNGGVGGIMIPVNKKVAAWDKAKRCDFHNFGHFHQRHDVNRVTVNGSVIGFNAYAMSIGADPEEPQQSFYLIDSTRGKTAQYPLWVRDSKDVPASWSKA